MRYVRKRLGTLKSRLVQYIRDIVQLFEDRVKKEKEIETKEGKWRRLTLSEFRELLFGYNETTKRRFLKYSLVAAHFAWYDCGLHNFHCSVIKSFEYAKKGKERDEVKKEVTQTEAFYQFALDCCDTNTMGCNIRAEYATPDKSAKGSIKNHKDLSSFMGLVKLNLVNASQFKKDQAKKGYKELFPGLKQWELQQEEIEWAEEEENDSEEDEEPSSKNQRLTHELSLLVLQVFVFLTYNMKNV